MASASASAVDAAILAFAPLMVCQLLFLDLRNSAVAWPTGRQSAPEMYMVLVAALTHQWAVLLVAVRRILLPASMVIVCNNQAGFCVFPLALF